MALLTTQKPERITIKAFPRVTELLDDDLPLTERPNPSKVLPFGGVSVSEGCLVTKGVKYTHEFTRWIEKSDDTSVIVSFISVYACGALNTYIIF
jgi:hypothetical protein